MQASRAWTPGPSTNTVRLSFSQATGAGILTVDLGEDTGISDTGISEEALSKLQEELGATFIEVKEIPTLIVVIDWDTTKQLVWQLF